MRTLAAMRNANGLEALLRYAERLIYSSGITEVGFFDQRGSDETQSSYSPKLDQEKSIAESFIGRRHELEVAPSRKALPLFILSSLLRNYLVIHKKSREDIRLVTQKSFKYGN